MYLHLMKQLGLSEKGQRQVAFYHRNSSEQRKSDILTDLKLPLGCPDKKLLAVVATVSLGRHFARSYSYFKGQQKFYGCHFVNFETILLIF